MIPLKIEISENAGSGYDVTVLGIGETGRKAIREYPCPVYGGVHWAIKTLTLCDDDAFQHECYPKVMTPHDSPFYLEKCRQKICDVVKNSDVLFVIADIDKAPDYENAFRFANLHRSSERKKGHNVLIDCSDGNISSEITLSTVFDLVISNRSVEKIYRPIEMLLSDMYTQIFGLDFADVRALVESTPKMEFLEDCVADREALKELTARFDSEIQKKKCEDDVFHALLYFYFPCSSEWEAWEDAYDILKNSSLNGTVIIQVGFNEKEDDNSISFSLLYGRERMKQKSNEGDGGSAQKDLLTEF